jgi:hypothetical protein
MLIDLLHEALINYNSIELCVNVILGMNYI